MAEKFSIKGLIKSLSMPFCILAVLSLLLVLFAQTRFDGKTSSTNPETAQGEVKIEPRDAGVTGSAAGMRPPVSQGADLQKKDSSDKKNNHIKLLTRKNNLLLKDSGAFQEDAAGDQYAAAEDLRLLDEESLVDAEGTMYTEAQLAELDPETIRLVEEEIRQALEDQPAVAQEFYQEEMDKSLAEEVAALEEERLLYPEGTVYNEAQLNEFDPETIRLVEEEIRQATE